MIMHDEITQRIQLRSQAYCRSAKMRHDMQVAEMRKKECGEEYKGFESVRDITTYSSFVGI